MKAKMSQLITVFNDTLNKLRRMKVKPLITIFNDITLDNELKLRDYYSRTIVPEIVLTKKVKSVKFEFITEGLLFGKVLGKKSYEVEIPKTAYNKIINSEIRTDKIVLRIYSPTSRQWKKKEVKINWPVFYFMNPDKTKVKIKELRRKQRKEGWRGKSFEPIFWDWDGSVTLRVILEFEDGTIAYIDLLRVIFVYNGNKSAALKLGNEKRREYKRRIKWMLKYISLVYGDMVSNIVRTYIHLLLNKPSTMKEDEYRRQLEMLRTELKMKLGNRRAYNFVMKIIESIARMRKELSYVSALMNRTSGSGFIVIVEYRKLFNPVVTEDGLKNEPVRFYGETKASHTGEEERWIDEFGNQLFVITRDWRKEIEKLGFTVKKETVTYSMEKRFRFLGKKGPLNHEIKATPIPPEDVVVEKVEQADVEWLWKNVKLQRPKTEITVLFGEKDGKEYIIYVVRPVDRAGRYIISNFDHRNEGKDRIIAHVNVGKHLLFIHRL